MFTSVGKKHTIAAMIIFGANPNPKIIIIIGDNARTGMVLNNNTKGK